MKNSLKMKELKDITDYCFFDYLEHGSYRELEERRVDVIQANKQSDIRGLYKTPIKVKVKQYNPFGLDEFGHLVFDNHTPIPGYGSIYKHDVQKILGSVTDIYIRVHVHVNEETKELTQACENSIFIAVYDDMHAVDYYQIIPEELIEEIYTREDNPEYFL